MYNNAYEVFGLLNYRSACLVFEDTPINNCVLKVKVITYNDIHLLINPMYLNVAELFISKWLQYCFLLENLFENTTKKFRPCRRTDVTSL